MHITFIKTSWQERTKSFILVIAQTGRARVFPGCFPRRRVFHLPVSVLKRPRFSLVIGRGRFFFYSGVFLSSSARPIAPMSTISCSFIWPFNILCTYSRFTKRAPGAPAGTRKDTARAAEIAEMQKIATIPGKVCYFDLRVNHCFTLFILKIGNKVTKQTPFPILYVLYNVLCK